MKLTPKRKSRLVRRADGTFKKWKGGRTLSQLKKKQNNFLGIQIHIGKEFVRQRGRKAKVGEVVRTKKKNGTYHKGAFWYIRTKHGWRKTRSTTKPSAATIKSICKRARKGRP